MTAVQVRRDAADALDQLSEIREVPEALYIRLSNSVMALSSRCLAAEANSNLKVKIEQLEAEQAATVAALADALSRNERVLARAKMHSDYARKQLHFRRSVERLAVSKGVSAEEMAGAYRNAMLIEDEGEGEGEEEGDEEEDEVCAIEYEAGESLTPDETAYSIVL